jgi:hypothetical protein
VGGKKCDCCDNPAVCWHDWHGGGRCYLCGDCCAHGGEEGECYRVRDDAPMSELSDAEVEEEGRRRAG